MQHTIGGRYRLVPVAALVLTLSGCVTPLDVPAPGQESTGAADSADARADDAAELLFVQVQRDGDSFVATNGVEYRVGMVNTPEVGTCGAAEATAFATLLLKHGFSVDAYSTDTHGRSVARVTGSDGRDLGVELARRGLADDRYLDGFRDENPAYAADLDEAFAEARAAGVAPGQTAAPGC